MPIIILAVTLLLCLQVTGQEQLQLTPLTDGTNTSLRGMSIPTANVVWVSGSNGTVGRSVDGGATWQWTIVPGLEKRDFRDIHAFDSATAVIMGIDNPAYILRTTDGGKTWKTVFEKTQEGMFLDAMYFSDKKEGICIGDPLAFDSSGNKRFYLIRTHDGGATWKQEPEASLPTAQPQEAIFSASGTNIALFNNGKYKYGFVTGGTTSNLRLVGNKTSDNQVINIPVNQGVASAGTFSMDTDGKGTFYCVGGNYSLPADRASNFAYTTNYGASWVKAKNAPPFGYRSCIRLIKQGTLLACGTNGIDYTRNNGKQWLNISSIGYNVCMVSPDKKTAYFAGAKGSIARLVW